MTYVKQKFTDGSVLTASQLNYIEDNKQDILESGINIKTINGQSILGGGDITISGDGSVVSTDRIDIKYILQNGLWGTSDKKWYEHKVCNYFKIKGPFVLKVAEGYSIYTAYEYKNENDEDFEGATKILTEDLGRREYSYTGNKYVGFNIVSSSDANKEIQPLYEIITELYTFGTDYANKVQGKQIIKNAIFFGDSITHGVFSYYKDNVHDDAHRCCGWHWNRAYKTMPDYFAEYSGACTMNAAARGSGWVIAGRYSSTGNNSSGNGPWFGNAIRKMNAYDFSKYDFVGICFGINDYLQQASLGTFPDSGEPKEGTVTGNAALMIQKILSENPLCKIVVYSPYNAWGQVAKGESSNGGYTANTEYGSFETNYALNHKIKSFTLAELIDAVDKVCRYYGIEHVPLCASNVCNRLTVKEIMIEGLHASLESMPRLAAELFADKNYGK